MNRGYTLVKLRKMWQERENLGQGVFFGAESKYDNQIYQKCIGHSIIMHFVVFQMQYVAYYTLKPRQKET